MNQHQNHPDLIAHHFSSSRHTTKYLECGPTDGPLMMLLHGFPSTSLAWRSQMEKFGSKGWHCVAPDMRGYGGSSAPHERNAYTIREIVADMVELHSHIGNEPAVWIGHDWGSIVAGTLAAHHPQRCRAVALVSWAYFPKSNRLQELVSLVDRSIYPADMYPDGQWDYARYYTTHFDEAVADLDADRAAFLASAYRAGDPSVVGKVSPMAVVTRNGGRFGSMHRAPPTKPDPALWPPSDFGQLVEAFDAKGFRGPCAWYTNDDDNAAYALEAPGDGRLSMPVLFVNGEYDQICSIVGNHQGDPMRASCSDFTISSLPGGHWLPLECKQELIQVISGWLTDKSLGIEV